VINQCALQAVAVVFLTLSSVAIAAEGSTTGVAEEQPLNEVVVTATKRDTKLEETPVAITAFTADQIQRQRLYNFTDIAERAPGLEFIPYSRQEAYVSIRGTTTNSAAAGADLGVTVFIDDVPTIGVGDNNPDLFDLQSVEVLRGPQGTLFGRNVTGGALVVRTLPPTFTQHESVEVTYGNYNLAEVRSYLTGPIIDNTLAGKIALQYRRQDGYLDNVDSSSKALSTSTGGGRVQLLWTPDADLKILFGADYNKDSSPYKSTQLIGNFQPSLFPPLSYSPNNTNEGIRGTGDAKDRGAFARVDYATPIGTWTSITGFRDIDDRNYHSTSGEPANELLQYAIQKGRQVTEEIRLGSAPDQDLTWVAGLFYLDANRRYTTIYGVDILPGVVVSYIPPYNALRFTSTSDQQIYAHSYAAFGEAGYALTNHLKLTLGARYTKEDKSGHSAVFDTSGADAPLYAPYYSHSWNAFTPKATLSYQPTTNILTYLTASRGFKSGGYDTTGTTVAGLETPFQPETVTNYEAGFKVSGFSNRLVVNLAGYYADYKDLQVNEYNQQLLQFITANAGRAKIPGAELEVSANPLPWLSLTAGYSYIGANYSTYVDGTSVYSGNQIPFDAKNQYHFGGELHFHTPQIAGGEIRFGGDVTYLSKIYFDAQNATPSFILNKTPIDGLVNLHLTWASQDDDWEVSLWGKNVTDSRYLIVASDLTPFYASFPEYKAPAGNKMFAGDFNPPAMYGISFTFKR
jgi:iron complex outermembrane recepter protein